ncbi:MAG TPA: ribosome maturation factor RimM [Pseudomonadales bacterium]
MVVVGRFGPPFGVKGWLNVISYTDPLTNLAEYRPWFAERNGQWTKLTVVELKPHRRGFVAQLEGIADRDVAQSFSGRSIGIPDNALPATDEDEFYWKDLIGLDVEDPAGNRIGEVAALIETGANDVIVVRTATGEILIPFVRHAVTEVDLRARRIVVDWQVDE